MHRLGEPLEIANAVLFLASDEASYTTGVTPPVTGDRETGHLMTKAELVQRVRAAIDKRATDIIALGEDIRRHPELGFKEFRTARVVAATLAGLGLEPRTGLAITGVRADARGAAGDGPICSPTAPPSAARCWPRPGRR